LRFRELRDEDLDAVAEVLPAPEAAGPHRGLGPREYAEHWISWNRRNYVEHGHGLWVIERHDGRFVGDCGLTIQDVAGEPMVEVGYHVHPELRGQGLATEAAAAVLAAARDAGVPHLVAIIRPGNLASQRVAAKIGLRLERRVSKNGGDALVFGTEP
jgi:RimJ/RimL family protein N-acetyltransferase